jgi:hypothetical protein
MKRLGRLAAAAATLASAALVPALTVTPTTAAAATPPAGTFHPVARAVLADTRTGLDTDRREMSANETRTFAVAGHAGIPSSGVVSVIVQVVADRPAHATTLQAWYGARRPHVAPMPALAGRVTMTTVPVGLAHGAIVVTNGPSATHLRLVVEGWWSTADGPPGMQLRPMLPRLVFDQTVKTGSAASFFPNSVHLGPPTSVAVFTMTASAATTSGTVTLAPSGGAASGYPADLAVSPGLSQTGTSVVQVGPFNEGVSISTTAVSVRLRLWITASAGFSGTVPDAGLQMHTIRVFDTRNATSTSAKPVATGAPRSFRLGGMFGVPDDHVAAAIVAVTVTARSPLATVNVAPTDAVDTNDAPVVAVLGFPVQATRFVRLGTGGRLTVAAVGVADVEIDVVAWVKGASLLMPSIQANPPDPNTLNISASGLLDPVVSPDGETAYAVDIGAAVIRRFNLRYGVELTPIALTAPATGIDLLPGGRTALVVEPAPLTNVQGGEVQDSVRVERVDVVTGARTSVPTPPRLNAVDVVQMSDGTLLFAPPGGRIASNTARTVAWQSGAGGYAGQGHWDITDRTWLYGLGGDALSVNDDATVVATGPEAIHERPADGPARDTSVPAENGSCQVLLLSADGATAYDLASGDLVAVDIASGVTRAQAPMPDVRTAPYYPLCAGGAVSPDGHTVVVTTDHGLSVTDIQ